jgi:hypothetical protein
MEPRIKNVSYKIEFNSCLYDLTQYFDKDNTLIADTLSVDGVPISNSFLSIRKKLSDFVKENKLTYI